VGCAFRQLPKNELDGNATPPNDGFALHYFRVNLDSIGHDSILQSRRLSGTLAHRLVRHGFDLDTMRLVQVVPRIGERVNRLREVLESYLLLC
jgi:hypothetical protein